MAVGMIFGLLVSTFLTLGLVPLLYALFYNVDFSGVTAAATGGAGPVQGANGTGAPDRPARAPSSPTDDATNGQAEEPSSEG
jgi:hypothetical protein